ncbi:MAG: hypothetical protein ACRD1D_10460 [Acidimicrobiales bacterium]
MVFLLVGAFWPLPVSPAAAQDRGPCYPPPCATEAPQPVSAVVGPAPVAGGPATEPDHRSPVPFVAMGLLAVAGSLTVVGLRRRSHIVRRNAPAPGPPARIQTRDPALLPASASGAESSVPSHAAPQATPQAALRSSLL